MGRIFEPSSDKPISVHEHLRNEGYKKWYFTFGCGQVNAGKCQPIYAKSANKAREKMFDIYGEKWCWQYTEEEWKEIEDRPDRYWPMEEELPELVMREE